MGLEKVSALFNKSPNSRISDLHMHKEEIKNMIVTWSKNSDFDVIQLSE